MDHTPFTRALRCGFIPGGRHGFGAAIVALMSAVAVATAAPPAPAEGPAPANFADLREALLKEMKHSGIPAAGIVVIDADGSNWIAGLGMADIAGNTAADADTQFRIGSTSKMFVSLAILQLQERGRLRLTDRVRELVPEVAFENPWEATNPVLVGQLLEHTTGWDDIHLVEYASSDPKPLTLSEGLALHPQSRVSRWVPGTRMAYCNSGPAVAAAIVEKVTGQRFEDYVREKLFRPIGLEHASYFADEHYLKHGAKLYSKGLPQPYWHLSLRPAGAINASPADMAHLLRFFLHRGVVGGRAVVSEESLQRMETPSTTPAAAAGLQIGYGLANYSSFSRGYRFQGHSGGVNGGLTEFSYCRELGTGHVVMINRGNIEGLKRLVNLITEFESRRVPAKVWGRQAGPAPALDLTLEGRYAGINPRIGRLAWMGGMPGARRYEFENGELVRRGLFGGEPHRFIPVSPTQFRSAESGEISLVITADPLAGPVLVDNVSGFFVGRRTPLWQLLAPAVLLGLWALATLGSFVYAMVWGIRLATGRLNAGPAIRVHVWPLMAGVAGTFFAGFLLFGLSQSIERLGRPTLVSVGITISTIAFALLSLWSIVIVVRERQSPMGRWDHRSSAALSVLHLGATAYLFAYGLIGLCTWR